MQISKEFKFEMAHKLSNSYTKKCQHIHGHSYRLVVTLLSDLTEPYSKEGVLLDYTFLKEMVSPLVAMLDHNFMIHRDDPSAEELIAQAKAGNFPLIVCLQNPTAERIAVMFAHQLAQLIKTNGLGCVVSRLRVAVFETATSEASVEIHLQEVDIRKDFDFNCQKIF